MSAFLDLQKISTHLNSVIIGQSMLIERLLISLIADGHLLVEGAPGLAKTKAIKDLSNCIDTGFQRIQFTPDLLPADITGTEIYRPENNSFEFMKGPIFNNLILADEINRAPAKVQSALLEAMAEKQVSIGIKTHSLPKLFLVMATQNPIEQEGTYPLPEAQLDRFQMHVRINYPSIEHEKNILQLARDEFSQQKPEAGCHVSQDVIFSARQELLGLHMEQAVEDFIVQLVDATRRPENYDSNLSRCIEYGSSPRGTIALERCARAHAWLNKQDFVSPENVHAIAHDVLRHRLILTFEAEAEGITTDSIIDKILKQVAIT